ncbi:hypothetical protein LT85_2125 [Collimonas arenae]|uniref:OmpR/PhoB-type domain-containing protein n=1 Tax=Collimonas arenae TaxID=279058 RepID=A0A0A1F991_9BURK|nr:tetratricopeptide repeat protein [Collimonas arenae]AIY41283.1 hypothetical protein LT85_2125 [Collimonas arenae]
MNIKLHATSEISPHVAGFIVDQDGFVFFKDAFLFLSPKERGAFRLLLEAWPNVVSKAEFSKNIWAGRMSDGGLARCITRLRHSLAPFKLAHIDSFYKGGYRLTIVPEEVMASAPVVSRSTIHARPLDPEKVDPALIEACTYARQLLEQRSLEAIDRAELVLRNTIASAPDYVAAKLLFAQCAVSKINYGADVKRSVIDEGLTMLEWVEDIAPQTPGLQSQIGRLLDCKWDFHEARLRHKRALAMFPDDATANLNYGLHLLIEGAYSDAVAVFRTAVELNPFSPHLAVILARAGALASGDVAEAVALARATYLSHKDSVQTYLYLLCTLATKDPQPEIAHAARHFARTRATWALASGAISYILARCGDHAGALEIISKESKEDAGIHAIYTGALLSMGMLEEAMTRVKKAVACGCGPLPIILNMPENLGLHKHPDYPEVRLSVFSRVANM